MQSAQLANQSEYSAYRTIVSWEYGLHSGESSHLQPMCPKLDSGLDALCKFSLLVLYSILLRDHFSLTRDRWMDSLLITSLWPES